jgi:hypothetical protein
MEQSLLVELIRTLKSEEKAQILHFAALQFFNNGRMKTQVVPLLDICLNHPWYSSEQRLEKKEVFAKVFPDQVFVEGKLEKVMVEAHKVVRAFLLAQRYFKEENEFQQLLDFSEEVRTRGLDTRYHQLLAKLQKMQLESQRIDAQFFRRQYLLEHSKSNEESIHNQAKGDLNIPNTIHALELDFYLNRLVLLNHFLLQQKIARLESVESVLEILEENEVPQRYLAESAVIRINNEIFFLMKKGHPSPSEVQNLFELLLVHEQSIDPKMLLELYTHLRNLCVLSLTADYEQAEMYNVLNKLYKDNLGRGYLHFEGKINRSRYWAVSSNAINIKDLEWALEFIETYKTEIRDENETRDLYRLNYANYLFAKGRYSECLDNIPPTSPFVDYLLHGKRLELKALYELQSDLLEYKLDAFKMFLSRTSQKLLSEAQRQIHSDFANFLHQLVNSKPADPKRSDLLVSRLQEKKQSAEWRWLLEKAKALKST